MYSKVYADHVSFAGEVVKTMARSGRYNIFDGQADLVTDEALRKYRMVEEEIRRGREKKVSITVPDDTDMHKEINRRQTGFVRPEDLARMRQFERSKEGDLSDDDADDAELDDYLPYTRQVSIQQPQSQTSYKKKMAFIRKIGATPPDDKEKEEKEDVRDKTSSRTLPNEVEEEEIFKSHFSEPSVHGVAPSVPGLVDDDDEEETGKPANKFSRIVGWRSGSGFHVSRLSNFSDDRRVSVLTRLIDDVSTDEGPGPTLKDYKPLMEQHQKTPLFLITYSPEKYKELKNMSDDSRELYLQRRHSISTRTHQQENKPMDILLLQHGKKVYRKISTDYVKTIDQIEQKEETSLRSLEYAKHRPAITIRDYQKKNKAYNDSLARQSKLLNDNVDNKKK